MLIIFTRCGAIHLRYIPSPCPGFCCTVVSVTNHTLPLVGVGVVVTAAAAAVAVVVVVDVDVLINHFPMST